MRFRGGPQSSKKRRYLMTTAVIPKSIRHMALLTIIACVMFTAATAPAQMMTFSQQDLRDYTAQNPFGRLSDGRPKVPDDLFERARGLSSEEVWAVLQAKGYNNQYADGFQVLHPGKMLVGSAYT